MNATTPSSTPRPSLLRRAAMVIALWATLIGLFTVQTSLVGSANWSAALVASLQFWWPWMLLSPLVAWLAFRFPFENGQWARSALVHLVALTLIALVEFQLQPPPGPGPPGAPPGRRPRGPGGDGPGEAQGFRGPSGRRGGPPPAAAARRAGFRTAFDVLLYALVVTGCHAVTYFRRSEQRQRRTLELEASLAGARLQALRSQLNPHFLFNALNAISTLVHTRPEAADEMIANLSQLLRLSLETTDEQEIPLCRELEFVARYLDVEKVRFGDRLRVDQQVDPGVGGALVPPLLLQPLVENAVRHGLEPQRGPGTLTLRATRQRDRLRLSVADDGVGLASKTGAASTEEASPRAGRSGIGLGNTRQRLQEIYGEDHRFTLGHGPNGGCVVEIDLPFRTRPGEADPLPITSTPPQRS